MRGLATLALGLGLLASACSPVPDEPAGIVREPAPMVADVSLPEATSDGTDFAFTAEDAGVLVVYFGYTSCPDVCPTTMADLRRALEELGSDAERVDVAMATIDPDRDTDEVLTGYVRSFVEDGHALRTTDDAELREATNAFGADYTVTTVDGTVEVEHTGFLYAVDDAGRLALTWPFGTHWEDIHGDLLWLLHT